jgi:lipopolysaccharide transport system ATP-binding protein
MSRVVVDAEGVGKRYQIRQRGAYGYVALRDVLADGAANAVRRLTGRGASGERLTRNDFWAVRDASFQLHEGDRLGLIGRNGAGKSTLLKILSRITDPTEGRVTLRGRVASLLEVGTGFHPELTGRENVYLNGTILGMRRAEITRKFDEIVAFAEIDKFLDTPVKRYSSGMYVRLAFAVAAHLQQEILLVDEVLAVGDAAFQKKSLGKMSEVAREGRTIVLVSHNLVAIEQLCTQAIWMDSGRIVDSGPAGDVVARYNTSFAAASTGHFEASAVRGDGTVTLDSYEVLNATGATTPLPVTGEDVILNIRMNVRERITRPAAGISVWSPTGVLLVSVDTGQLGQELETWEPGERTLTIRLGKVPFLPGAHRVDLWVQAPGGHLYAHVEDAIAFEIGQSPLYGTSYIDRGFGCVFTSVEVSASQPAEPAAASTEPDRPASPTADAVVSGHG